MRIAQIAPVCESVPPKGYGGTERVVSWLTEELVRRGHRVTLFASGDSRTRGRLVPVVERAVDRGDGSDSVMAHILEIGAVQRRLAEFDVLHSHIDYLAFPAFRDSDPPLVTTLHGRLDIAELAPIVRHFWQRPLVSISDSQRAPLPAANWVATVHHGLPEPVCPFNPAPRGQYLAFLGRVSPEKGLDRAIEIARRAGQRLRVAAKIDSSEESYWRSRIAPLVSDPLIEFVGEVNEEQTPALLGNAKALLFPIDWPEPFGLAMIEAMSCGTPVIAWPHGSVPEIVEHGVTGYIVSSIEQALAALHDAGKLDRAQVRRRFEERFSAARMAQDYLRVYRGLAKHAARARTAGETA